MTNSPSPKYTLLFSTVIKDKEENSLRSHCRARGMAQWVNGVCAMPDDQSLASSTHMMKGRTNSGRFSYNLYMYAVTLFTRTTYTKNKQKVI